MKLSTNRSLSLYNTKEKLNIRFTLHRLARASIDN